MQSQQLGRVLTCSFFFVLAIVTPSFAKTAGVSSELLEKARTQGSVHVVVQINTPSQLEENLSGESVTLQRMAIAQVCDAVLNECDGTMFEVTRRFEGARYFAVQASYEALLSLSRSLGVANVVEIPEGGAPDVDATEMTVGMLEFGDRMLAAFAQKAAESNDPGKGGDAPQLSAPVQLSLTAPYFSVQVDKSTYVEGDTVKVTEFRLANPKSTVVKVDIKVRIKVPLFGSFTLINVSGIQLSANLDIDLGAFSLFKVSKYFPPKGNYEFNTSVTLAGVANEDLNSFTIQ